MSYVKNAAFVLAVIGLVAFLQTKVGKAPIVGAYLPGGTPD